MAKKQVIQEQKIIDSIKALGIDMIDNAGSGHPGIVLGAAPILYTLFTRHLNFNVNDEKWINRDRFVMSAGHGSALLYAILFMAGFKLTIDDLKSFRKLGSKTPGHPEYGITPGVEMTTGPLGQGFASAVGMAMAECFLATKYNVKKKAILESSKALFNYYTYVLCSDGDLMEGVTYEVASLAGNLKLGKLIVLYDSNNISLDGSTDLTFTENVLSRFEALGWHTELVRKGDSIDEIDKAIEKAKKVDKPSIIEIKTVLGRGSLSANTNAVHGTPLSKEDILQLKNNWGLRDIPFAVSKDVVEQFRDMISKRVDKKYKEWMNLYKLYMEKVPTEIKVELGNLVKNNTIYDIDLPNLMWEFDKDMKEQMRNTNAKIMNVIADKISNFIGGSADVSSSTKVFLSKYGIYSPNSYDGRNIFFGVREHAMASILNGIALSGLRVFGSTLLVFADYLKPALRLSCLMNLPITYIFTHDSINIGADGPTHQPIEQLAMLRSIPNLDVYRPADAREIVGAWNTILKNDNPSALMISRQEAPLLINSKAEGVERGAYIIKKEAGPLLGIIIATGSEVNIAITIADYFERKGINIRVISMPCIERFLRQSHQYKDSLIPIGYKTFVIEAGSSLGWERFVYNEKYLMTIDEFGKSGTSDQIQTYFEFDIVSLIKKIEKLLK